MVYTFYNMRRRTVRGEVLRVPGGAATRWHDEWRQQPIAARIDRRDFSRSEEEDLKQDLWLALAACSRPFGHREPR
jgi:hypothetical protein